MNDELAKLCRYVRHTGAWLVAMAAGALAAHAAAQPDITDPCTIANIIRDIGFPVAVASFVVIRTDQSIRSLTVAIANLGAHCPLVDKGGIK